MAAHIRGLCHHGLDRSCMDSWRFRKSSDLTVLSFEGAVCEARSSYHAAMGRQIYAMHHNWPCCCCDWGLLIEIVLKARCGTATRNKQQGFRLQHVSSSLHAGVYSSHSRTSMPEAWAVRASINGVPSRCSCPGMQQYYVNSFVPCRSSTHMQLHAVIELPTTW